MKSFFTKGRYVLFLALLGAALTCAACATTRVAGECPESRNLTCLAGKICSPDQKRGCQVCHCDAPTPKTITNDGEIADWNSHD